MTSDERLLRRRREAGRVLLLDTYLREVAYDRTADIDTDCFGRNGREENGVRFAPLAKPGHGVRWVEAGDNLHRR